MSAKNNILIVRTDKIGDVVLTLPIAGIIKKALPGAKVTFLVKSYTRNIVALNKYVDDIIVLPEINGAPDYSRLTKTLRSKKFDVAVTVYPRAGMVWSLFKAGIKTRIGTGYRWYSFLFNKKVYEHRKYGTSHELDLNIKLLSHLGINYTPEPNSVDFSIQPGVEAAIKVKNVLEEKGINTLKKYVIIHPGSHGSAIDWPLEHFKELVHILARDLTIDIVITGSLNEFEICQKLVVGENVFNLAGLFTLEELTALIGKSKLLIANSTGPIHIAAALNKWVIGFYPKIPSCSVTRWGPYTNKRIVFEPETGCSNCTRKQCEELNCMSSIKPEKVANAVKTIFSGKD